jgi:hypothetical protein
MQVIVFNDCEIIEKLFDIVGCEPDVCDFSVRMDGRPVLMSGYERLEFWFDDQENAEELAQRIKEQLNTSVVGIHDEKFTVEERGMRAEWLFKNFALSDVKIEYGKMLKVIFKNIELDKAEE